MNETYANNIYEDSKPYCSQWLSIAYTFYAVRSSENKIL